MGRIGLFRYFMGDGVAMRKSKLWGFGRKTIPKND
jgi:hypothetical protein